MSTQPEGYIPESRYDFLSTKHNTGSDDGFPEPNIVRVAKEELGKPETNRKISDALAQEGYFILSGSPDSDISKAGKDLLHLMEVFFRLPELEKALFAQ